MQPDDRRNKAPEAEPRSGWQQKAAADFSDKAVPPTDAFRAALHQIGELKEIGGYFVAAKVDALKLTVRTLIAYAVLGILGLFIGAAALVTATVLLLTGLSGALGALFGGRAWAGAIVVSLVILAAVGLGAWIGIKRMTGSSRKQTVKKYESRQQDQRSRYGHSIPDLAAYQQQYGSASADQ